MIAVGAHADDLPKGDEAATQEIARRVGRHYGGLYGDPDAVWLEVRVVEAEGVDDADIPPEVRALLRGNASDDVGGA